VAQGVAFGIRSNAANTFISDAFQVHASLVFLSVILFGLSNVPLIDGIYPSDYKTHM